MKQHLETLRAKPDHVKRQIAFLTSLGITAVILVVWMVSFHVQTASAGSKTIDSPVSSMTASVSEAWQSIKQIISGSSASVDGSAAANNAIEVVPGNQ